MRFFKLLFLLSLLQACATNSPIPTANKPIDNSAIQKHLQSIATIQSFNIKGRIGVQTDSKGFSGSLNWQHHAEIDDIAIFSPLGGQVASIKKTASLVTLEDTKGNSISATDAETLTQSTLGWKLPLTGLADWAIGRPTNSPVQSSTADNLGRLTNLKQDDWDIEYSDYAEVDGMQLPNKVYLRSPKVNIKLIVENRSLP